jgi:DNA-binding LacI/PurR family transcriptional regulator
MNPKSAQTIADIARLAGVSKSTVSRALSDSPLICDETKERIRGITKDQHFQINLPARRLSKKESNTIAFVTHGHHKEFSFADLFTLEILSSISRALAENGYDLLMVQVDPMACCDWSADYLDTGRADGFILMTSTRKNAHIKSLLEMGSPFIVWGVPLPGHSYPSVTGDNFTGGKLAVEHFVRTGRRKIAFLGGPADELEVQRRYDGYAAAMKEAGIEVVQKRVGYGDFSTESSAETMRQLLEGSPDLDAVFVNSDLMAMSAMDVLRANGRRVPEDVAVIGYDNLSIAEVANPPLTTVSQNLPQAGKLLAQNLIQYLRTGVVTNVVVPVNLEVRKSA